MKEAAVDWRIRPHLDAIYRLNGLYHQTTDSVANSPKVRARCREIAQQIKLHEIEIQRLRPGKTPTWEKKGGTQN